MAAPIALRKFAQRLGIFPMARKLYRRISPEVRRQLAGDIMLYRQMIKNDDLVFDIGCNLGQKAGIFLHLGARVVALEPNPNCAPVLKLEFGDNPNFELVGKAVGAEVGEAMLNFSNTISTASLREDWHGLQYRDGELKKTKVDVTTLDELIERYGVPVFCKIDVEGFETAVLKGLSQPLRMLSLEYHRDEPADILECLEILGRLSPFHVNVIEMNSDKFLFDEWHSFEEFRTWLSGPDVPRAGDVFVRSASLN